MLASCAHLSYEPQVHCIFDMLGIAIFKAVPCVRGSTTPLEHFIGLSASLGMRRLAAQRIADFAW